MIFEITFHWWYIAIALFVAPIIYAELRPAQGGWIDLQLDTMLAFACFWFADIIFILTNVSIMVFR